MKLASLNADQKRAIRVYLYQGRFSGAVDVYCSAGAEREEAVAVVELIYRDLRTESGFLVKAIFFGLLKSLSVAIPFAITWAIVGSLWAWALRVAITTTALWTFVVAFAVGLLLGQTLFRREHSVALSTIYTTLAMLAGVTALIAKVVRWLL